MRRTAIDETGRVVDIRDVPQDMAERHLHSYVCEGCGMRLIPKKGTQQIHHFAHASNVDCDPWSQSMTAWHIAGQDVMATLGARLEVPCDKGNVTHRADAVFDRHNTVVELQHSSMSLETFIERNEFYLRRFDNLVWLFDARGFADRLPCLARMSLITSCISERASSGLMLYASVVCCMPSVNSCAWSWW